jgi:hypothetical protein
MWDQEIRVPTGEVVDIGKGFSCKGIMSLFGFVVQFEVGFNYQNGMLNRLGLKLPLIDQGFWGIAKDESKTEGFDLYMQLDPLDGRGGGYIWLGSMLMSVQITTDEAGTMHIDYKTKLGIPGVSQTVRVLLLDPSVGCAFDMRARCSFLFHTSTQHHLFSSVLNLCARLGLALLPWCSAVSVLDVHAHIL